MKYKVGDRVRIKSLDWYNENKGKHGIVICGMMPFCGYMSCRCGTIVTISEILEWGYCIEEDYGENGWTDEMFEGLVEKKKKEYPKTIEECCKILGLEFNPFYTGVKHQINYKDGLLHNLKCLLIYRDAYWKLYGEEKGLGKPWEPNWKNDEQGRYMIMVYENKLHKDRSIVGTNFILVFPTEEMRDEFYENFKELIEQCKELL